MATYLPLQKMEELEESIEILDKNLEILQSNGFPKFTYDEYIEHILKLNMGVLDVSIMRQSVKIIFATYGDVFESLGVFQKDFINNPNKMMNEIMDYILTPYLLNIWRKNKQVYKPDNEFCNALLKTENLNLTKDMFVHLPCKNFYIDLSDCELFLPIRGIFVNVFLFDDTDNVSINFYLMDKDKTTWSSYDVLNFDKEKEIKISQKFMKEIGDSDDNYVATDYSLLNETDDCLFIEKILTDKGNQYNDTKLSRSEASFFVYQLLTYMVSHEPQIEDSQITKSTYRPPKTEKNIKNKFSEVQMHDVGIKFGKSFRQQKKQYKCNTILTKHLENKRKSPIPHFRAAHWQGYWIGRGRTEHIIKWIEPIFVNGEESNDVIIHKM